MTVKDLILKLSEFDPEITVYSDEACEIRSVTLEDDGKYPPAIVLSSSEG